MYWYIWSWSTYLYIDRYTNGIGNQGNIMIQVKIGEYREIDEKVLKILSAKSTCLHRDRKYISGCQSGGEWLLMDIGRFFWGWWKCSGIRCQWWLPSFVNILKINELCTLQGSVCVIWIISQFFKNIKLLTKSVWLPSISSLSCSLVLQSVLHSAVGMVLLIFKD